MKITSFDRIFAISTKLPVLLLLLLLLTGCAQQKPMVSLVIPVKNPIDALTINTFDTVSHPGEQYTPYLKDLIETGIVNEGFTRVSSDSNNILNGRINFGNVQTETFSTTSELGSKKKTIYHCVKKLTVTGNYTVADKKTGVTIFGDSFNITRAKEGLSHQSQQEAKARTVTDEQMVHFVLEEIAKEIVSNISYHKEPVELKTGKDPGIKQGITYLQNGRIFQAIGIWEQVVADPNVLAADKAAAYYNLGIARESQGEFKEAYELYSKANMQDPEEELYMQALTRVKAKFSEMQQ